MIGKDQLNIGTVIRRSLGLVKGICKELYRTLYPVVKHVIKVIQSLPVLYLLHSR